MILVIVVEHKNKGKISLTFEINNEEQYKNYLKQYNYYKNSFHYRLIGEIRE